MGEVLSRKRLRAYKGELLSVSGFVDTGLGLCSQSMGVRKFSGGEETITEVTDSVASSGDTLVSGRHFVPHLRYCAESLCSTACSTLEFPVLVFKSAVGTMNSFHSQK